MAGLYIHIPFCKSKCAYCDFPSFAGREDAAGRYFSAVVREAEMWREKLSPCPQITLTPNPLPGCMGEQHSQNAASPQGIVGGGIQTVFIGGGTPSLLPAGELERLMDGLRPLFDLAPVEFTVEANPGTVDKEKLKSFRRMGANRLSFGVQAAQDTLLKRIGRIHTWEDFVRSYKLAREAGFVNINADMMTGLPGQTINDAVDTVKKLVALGVEHVSCYGLIVEEGTKLAHAIQKGDEVSPDDDEERAMFHAAREVLDGAGIKRYEISNFAKPGMECLHNLNYWHNGSWLGLGLGAASQIPGRRRENRCDLDAYIAMLEAGVLPPGDEHEISAVDAAFETIMLGLRLVEGIGFGQFEAMHGFSFLARYAKQVEKFIASGLMQKTHNGVALTTKGMDFQNAVLMEFMD